MDKNGDGKVHADEIRGFYDLEKGKEPKWAESFFKTVSASKDSFEVTKDSIVKGFPAATRQLKSNPKMSAGLAKGFMGPGAKCPMPAAMTGEGEGTGPTGPESNTHGPASTKGILAQTQSRLIAKANRSLSYYISMLYEKMQQERQKMQQERQKQEQEQERLIQQKQKMNQQIMQEMQKKMIL